MKTGHAGAARCVTGVTQDDALDVTVREALACRVCAEWLPLGPRPVFQVSRTTRILINGQAPGTKAHITGIPFNDTSGERLRTWLQLEPEQFYDASRVAIVPMGLCYPGVMPNGGDAPPRPECAPLWLDRFMRLMPEVRLTLLVGSYAQQRRLGRGGMAERVRRFREFGPAVIPLPHPSWRTKTWELRNPWFAAELLPVLRAAVR
ncbi:MAG TPA: uracil-DNA glycosylase family protein, partial [Rhodopila sp.]|nr:uracil-DNA glycosylase family protein [Rhodopila sp.]